MAAFGDPQPDPFDIAFRRVEQDIDEPKFKGPTLRFDNETAILVCRENRLHADGLMRLD